MKSGLMDYEDTVRLLKDNRLMMGDIDFEQGKEILC